MTVPVTPERTYLGTRGDAGWTSCARFDCLREHSEHHAGELAMLCPAVVSAPVTPETLTDEMIRTRRINLTFKIIELERERYDCVLALGGGAMQEDAEPRDAAARQRICDAINVRRDQP